MTPLAHEIVIDSTRPTRERRHGDAMQRLRLLDDVHFFDLSEVRGVAGDLMPAVYSTGAPAERLAFLPAPRTFLEWRDSGGRVGLLMEAEVGDPAAKLTWIIQSHGEGIQVAKDHGWLCLHSNAGLRAIAFPDDRSTRVFREVADAYLYVFLSMINTPRVVGRRIHQPHAGLQRKIAAAHSMPGKYPLQAWHELVLEVKPPRDEGDREPQQTILTGGKALHFVRAYLRIRAGRLELVSSHWKGDPALGLKQTRYRVVPPRSRAA